MRRFMSITKGNTIDGSMLFEEVEIELHDGNLKISGQGLDLDIDKSEIKESSYDKETDKEVYVLESGLTLKFFPDIEDEE